MCAPRKGLIIIGVALVMLGCQPQDETPGLWLRGEIVEERVDDWGFTLEVDEIFVQTRPWYGIPHSTTIWCVPLDNELYVGSYGVESKVWERNIAREPRAELAIAGKRYRVVLASVTDEAQIEELNDAYARKYDMGEVFGDELPTWRYYRASQSP